MSNLALNPAVRLENARALAAALGLDDIEQVAKMLDLSILVTASPKDPAASALANDVLALLSRTVTHVTRTSGEGTSAVEVIIGRTPPQSRATRLQVNADYSTCRIGDPIAEACRFADIHPLFRRLVACYVSAAALKVALGDRLPFTVPTPLILDFARLGIDLASLGQDIDIGRAYLAGAGAIGNGLLWALQDLRLRGELHVVDFDKVEDGNLQRQIWFDETDVGRLKCEQLVAKAQPHFSNLTLVPRNGRLQDLDECDGGAWLRKLIVAVDSRRARRLLQNEAPGEVFDASTTDIREIVLHYHRQPTDGACLACIYGEDEAERDFESHIAAKLGVSVEKVRQLVIDPDAAKTIACRYSSIIADPSQIMGTPYDSLFKSLCGEGALAADDNHPPVIAPFAFVSALAGVMLAFEIIRRHTRGDHDQAFNHWRISPWQPPQDRLRRRAPAAPNCSFCAGTTIRSAVNSLWGSNFAGCL